jgi:hypothetical protein
MNLTAAKTLFMLLMLLQLFGALFSCATQAKAAGSVEILSHTGYLDLMGNYRVVGEVKNTGIAPVNFVQVNATFYDSYGQSIASRFDLTLQYVIPVGRKSPFELALLDVAQSSRVAYYTLSVSYLETIELPPRLELSGRFSYIDPDGNMHVIGNLTNHGDEILVNAKVVATYYDASLRVVAADLFGFDPEVIGDITPNRTVQFEIELSQDRAQHVQTYVLSAESNQYAMIIDYSPPWDINHDLKVDMRDVGRSARAFNTRPGDARWDPQADITGPEPLIPDGRVDMRDISLIAKHFGENY